MSAAAKQQRAEVAKVKMKEGFAHLKTGIFKWSKDYMLAGPAFWDAGMGFAYSGLPIEGQQAYLEAAKCYDCEGVTHKAASCYQQAATLAEKQGDLNTAAKWLDEAADRSMLGSSPDAGKAAQTLQKAALMVASSNRNLYVTLLMKAVEILDQADAVQLRSSLSVCDRVVGIYADTAKYEEGIALADKLATRLAGSSHESSFFLTSCIFHLAEGDAEGADRAFRDVHLQSTRYLAAPHCAVEEDLINAVKNFDDALIAEISASRAARHCSLRPELYKLLQRLQCDDRAPPAPTRSADIAVVAKKPKKAASSAAMSKEAEATAALGHRDLRSALLGANPHEGESGGGGGAAGGKPKSKYAKKKKKEIVKKAVPETELSSAAARVAEMERLEAEHAATASAAAFYGTEGGGAADPDSDAEADAGAAAEGGDDADASALGGAAAAAAAAAPPAAPAPPAAMESSDDDSDVC